MNSATRDDRKRIKRWLVAKGSIGAVMSGSGPTVVGIFREKDQAEEVGSLAKREWGECWIAVTMVQENASSD